MWLKIKFWQGNIVAMRSRIYSKIGDISSNWGLAPYLPQNVQYNAGNTLVGFLGPLRYQFQSKVV